MLLGTQECGEDASERQRPGFILRSVLLLVGSIHSLKARAGQPVLLGGSEEGGNFAMGYDRSLVLMNESDRALSQAVSRALEMGNASAGQLVWQSGNGSQAGAAESEQHGEEQSYRHFTTTVQVVIFVGSLLGE